MKIARKGRKLGTQRNAGTPKSVSTPKKKSGRHWTLWVCSPFPGEQAKLV